MFYSWRTKIEPDILVGTRVLSMSYKDGCEGFRIVTDKGTLHLSADSDCCSESWFQAFDHHEDLIGQVILSVEEREEPRDRTNDEGCRQEETQLYGAVFSYAGGSAYLELRNDSNGYYGGSVSLSWEPKEAV